MPTLLFSFSDPSSPISLPLNALSISPDPSTLNYDQFHQFLQDQMVIAVANQAIPNSQAFTTSITGQDMFVPGDLIGMPVEVDNATADMSAS
jgi:hypothetical protein